QEYFEVTLELEDPGPLGHNEIEVATAGSRFTRRVKVLGDRTEKFADPLTVADGHLVHYEFDGKVVDIRRLHYAPQQLRFLQVRAHPDAAPGEKIPKIESVTVRRTDVVPGKYVTLPASLQPREAVRGDGGPGSAWYIQLGEPAPCEK